MVFVFVPLYLFIYDLLTYCRKSKQVHSKEQNYEVDYDEIRTKFTNEYDRSNPVTKDQALKEYFNFIKSKFCWPDKSKDKSALLLLRGTLLFAEQDNKHHDIQGASNPILSLFGKLGQDNDDDDDNADDDDDGKQEGFKFQNLFGKIIQDEQEAGESQDPLPKNNAGFSNLFSGMDGMTFGKGNDAIEASNVKDSKAENNSMNENLLLSDTNHVFVKQQEVEIKESNVVQGTLPGDQLLGSNDTRMDANLASKSQTEKGQIDENK